jgi:hypothetical protein
MDTDEKNSFLKDAFSEFLKEGIEYASVGACRAQQRRNVQYPAITSQDFMLPWHAIRKIQDHISEYGKYEILHPNKVQELNTMLDYIRQMLIDSNITLIEQCKEDLVHYEQITGKKPLAMKEVQQGVQ